MTMVMVTFFFPALLLFCRRPCFCLRDQGHSHFMRWRWGGIALVLLLNACSTVHGSSGGNAGDKLDDQEAPHLKDEEIHADLIRQMLDKGQYYAALAHIEDQKRSGRQRPVDPAGGRCAESSRAADTGGCALPQTASPPTMRRRPTTVLACCTRRPT